MIKIIRRKKIVLPDLGFDGALMRKIGYVVEGGILDNISQQQQADGSPLKTNAPSTRAQKQRLGLPQLSLVAKLHELVRGKEGSFVPTVDVKRQSVIVRPISGQTANVVGWVQQKGYTGWFGVNDSAIAAIKAAIAQWIKQKFTNAAQGVRR